MKKVCFSILLAVGIFTTANAQWVNGYTKSNGTYVSGYNRSSSNYTKSDNYSTKGNINPYTGKVGTKTYNDYNNYGHIKSKSKSKSLFGN